MGQQNRTRVALRRTSAYGVPTFTSSVDLVPKKVSHSVGALAATRYRLGFSTVLGSTVMSASRLATSGVMLAWKRPPSREARNFSAAANMAMLLTGRRQAVALQINWRVALGWNVCLRRSWYHLRPRFAVSAARR
jgi:hypothetical protein